MATELVDASKLDACCTAEANAIRAKTGGSSPIAYDWANSKGFADAIAAIPSGGDSLDDFLGNEGAFASAYDIEIDSETVTGYSFWRRPVKILRMPNATEIGQNLCETCTSLEEVYWDSYVGNPSLPNTRKPVNAFSGCTALKKIYAPLCTFWTSGVTNSTTLTSLVDVELSPDFDRVDGGGFRGSSITMFCYPKATRIYNNVFQDCASLTTVDVSWANSNLESAVFTGARALTTLIIRSPTVRALNNISAFTGTPFASDGIGGTLYVPSALISSYQAAANWSTILGYTNNSIVAIEGSQYENYAADGTPIT